MHAAEGVPSWSLGCLLWAPSGVPETGTAGGAAGGTAGAPLRSPPPGSWHAAIPWPVLGLPAARLGVLVGTEREGPSSVWMPPPLPSDTHWHSVGIRGVEPAFLACP